MRTLTYTPCYVELFVCDKRAGYCVDNRQSGSCYSGKMFGICGNMNGDMDDDFKTKGGVDVINDNSNRFNRVCNSYIEGTIDVDK